MITLVSSIFINKMEDRITPDIKTKIKNPKRLEQAKRLALISKEAKAKKQGREHENIKKQKNVISLI